MEEIKEINKEEEDDEEENEEKIYLNQLKLKVVYNDKKLNLLRKKEIAKLKKEIIKTKKKSKN